MQLQLLTKLKSDLQSFGKMLSTSLIYQCRAPSMPLSFLTLISQDSLREGVSFQKRAGRAWSTQGQGHGVSSGSPNLLGQSRERLEWWRSLGEPGREPGSFQDL